MVGPPLLNIEHLAEIASLESHRPGLGEQMLTLFTDSARASMNICEAAWKAENREQLAMAVHRLKGSAAGLGAVRLRMLAAELERVALEERDEPIHAQRLQELDATLEETISAYRGWLEREGEIMNDN